MRIRYVIVPCGTDQRRENECFALLRERSVEATPQLSDVWWRSPEGWRQNGPRSGIPAPSVAILRRDLDEMKGVPMRAFVTACVQDVLLTDKLPMDDVKESENVTYEFLAADAGPVKILLRRLFD